MAALFTAPPLAQPSTDDTTTTPTPAPTGLAASVGRLNTGLAGLLNPALAATADAKTYASQGDYAGAAGAGLKAGVLGAGGALAAGAGALALPAFGAGRVLGGVLGGVFGHPDVAGAVPAPANLTPAATLAAAQPAAPAKAATAAQQVATHLTQAAAASNGTSPAAGKGLGIPLFMLPGILDAATRQEGQETSPVAQLTKLGGAILAGSQAKVQAQVDAGTLNQREAGLAYAANIAKYQNLLTQTIDVNKGLQTGYKPAEPAQTAE